MIGFANTPPNPWIVLLGCVVVGIPLVFGALRAIRWLDERFDVSETQRRAARTAALELLPEEWTFRGHSTKARILGLALLATTVVALKLGSAHWAWYIVVPFALGSAFELLNREDKRAIAAAANGMQDLVARVDTATAEQYFVAIGVIHGKAAERQVREAVENPDSAVIAR